MTDEAPSRQQDKFVLRMPDGMRDRIAKEAESNGRSMNAEIVQRLEASFRRSVDDEQVLEFSKKMESALKSANEEASAAKVGAAVSSSLLVSVLDRRVLSPALGLGEEQLGAIDRARRAAQKIIDIYSEVDDPHFGRVSDILADIHKKADLLHAKQTPEDAGTQRSDVQQDPPSKKPPAHKKPRAKRG